MSNSTVFRDGKFPRLFYVSFQRFLSFCIFWQTGDKSSSELQNEVRKMQQEEQDLKHQLSEENAKIADLEET